MSASTCDTPIQAARGSYIRGARIPALQCHAAEVLQELKTRNAVTLTDPVAIKMAKDLFIEDQGSSKPSPLSQFLSTARRKWGDNEFICKVWEAATVKDAVTSETPSTADSYVCSNQATLISIATQVIKFEIFSRYQAAYYANFLKSQTLSDALTSLNKDIGSTCESSCKAQIQGCPANVSDLATSCIQTCFNREFPVRMKTMVRAKWTTPATETFEQSEGLAPREKKEVHPIDPVQLPKIYKKEADASLGGGWVCAK